MKCFKVGAAVEMRPGRQDRQWMEETPQRFAYRCLPLTIANRFGWELILPERVVAVWNGNAGLSDIQIVEGAQHAVSHFGSGVLTFHTGYLFRTEPGVQLMARGAPNWPKDGIAPLEGVVETDWLPFTFTMNWKFTRPGPAVFDKGEPFCFVTPVKVFDAAKVKPEILPLEADREEAKRYGEWAQSRAEWNAKLAAGDKEVVDKGWQKFYTRGTHVDGAATDAAHLSKLKMQSPIER